MISQKLNTVAFANTFAIIDIILHPLFHLWIWLAPRSYEWTMNLFVAGLHLEVTSFDLSIKHIVVGTVVEATAFWVLGAAVALVYNTLADRTHKHG